MSPSTQGPGLHRYLATVLIAGLVALTPAGCGEEVEEPVPDTNAEIARLAREARQEMNRLDALLRAEAPSRDLFRSRVASHRNDLESFIQDAATVTSSEVDPERILSRGKALLETVRGPFRTACDIRFRGATVLYRCVKLRREIIRHLEAFNAPKAVPFALRNRFEDGWLPESDEWVKDFHKGINEVLQGGDQQRAVLAGKNLERCAVSGGELLTEVQVLLQRVQTGDRRLESDGPRILAYTQKVLEQTKAALVTGTAKPPVSNESAAQIVELRKPFADTVASLPAEWKAVRKDLLASKPDADQKAKALEKRYHEARSALFRAAMPVGNALGISPPGAELLK